MMGNKGSVNSIFVETDHLTTMNLFIIENEPELAETVRGLLTETDETISVTGLSAHEFSTGSWQSRFATPDVVLARPSLFVRWGIKFSPGIQANVTVDLKGQQRRYHAVRFNSVSHLLKNTLATEDLPVFVDEPFKKGRIKERFLVKDGQQLLSIAVSEIACFYTKERFIFLCTFDNKRHLVEYRIEELELLLDTNRFFRINRSLIISLSSVAEIHAYAGNRLRLVLTPDMNREVIVSRKRVTAFKKWLDR